METEERNSLKIYMRLNLSLMACTLLFFEQIGINEMKNVKNEYVSYSEDKTRLEDFTAAQRDKLEQLNKTLMQLEQNLKVEATKLTTTYNQKVKDKQEWINDYEAEINIGFWLKETDPAFDEDRDNILVELREPIFEDMKMHGIADGVNHNEFYHWKDHPMKGEFHCWLYHCLYDHTGLGWADMLRVGMIWTDIECRLQHFIHLDTDN